MGSTEVQDAWVHDVFGVAPQSYANSPTNAEAPPASPDADFHARYDPLVDGLNTAATRVVPAGDAQAAQDRLNAALAAINAAIKGADFATAGKRLDEAEKEARTVMAAPDPAMLPVEKKAHPDEQLYGHEKNESPGTPDVAETDINQNKIGDCFLLSSIGEIARIDPNLIKKMIKDNGDGTYTVTLHREKTGLGYLIGTLTGQTFEDVEVTVDGNFAAGTVNSGPGQDMVGAKQDKKEIWVQVLEKAYAKLHGGYAGIAQGGLPSDAIEALTGKKADYKQAKDTTLAELQSELATGKPVVMDTPPPKKGQTLPFSLVAGHAYMLDGIITDKDGKSFVKLRNPWGHDQPDPIPFDQLGKGIDFVFAGSVQ